MVCPKQSLGMAEPHYLGTAASALGSVCLLSVFSPWAPHHPHPPPKGSGVTEASPACQGLEHVSDHRRTVCAHVQSLILPETCLRVYPVGKER